MNKALRFFYIPPNADENKLFRKMIQISIALHVAVILFMGLKAAIFPSEALDLDAAIHVDMVGLPDKIAQLPEKPPEKTPEKAQLKEAPKTAVVEPPAKTAPVVLKPKHNDLSKAIQEIKKQEEAENRRKAVEDLAKEMKNEQRQEAVNKLLKGNVVSPGTALHGLTKTQFNEYIEQIHAQVQKNWTLPEFLQNDSLKATVVVFLDSRGVVVKRVLKKSSGDSRFDDYALKAVDNSSPFPTPPPQFVDLVRVEGFALGFPE